MALHGRGAPTSCASWGSGSAPRNVAVPGTNFAGVIEAVGSGVSGYEPGDEMYGATRGAFAEYAVAPISCALSALMRWSTTRHKDFADGSRRFDLGLDIGGRTSVARLRRTLTPSGTLVILGGEGDRWIGGTQRQLWASVLSLVVSLVVSQKLVAFVVKEDARELLKMNVLVASGKVTQGRLVIST